MTLDEIRESMKIRSISEEKLPDPISYEQHKVWNTLKQGSPTNMDVAVLNKERKSYSSVLECPKCDESYLHHTTIEMFSRNEDQDDGTHITLVEENSFGWNCLNTIPPEHSVDSDMTDNPSGRRSGVSIGFVCECCHGEVKLNISQDRGHSVMTWRYYK